MGLKQSSTSRTEVAFSSEMTRESNWPLSKCERTPHCRPLLDKPETIPITINMPMLQARMPRFAQVLQTTDPDVYGSLDLRRPIVSIFGFVFNKGGGNY